MKLSLSKYLQKTKESNAIIHCLTNYVTINGVANILLACGAKPIMAEGPLEAKDITALGKGLYINTGLMSDSSVKSMVIAGQESNRLNHPVVLDPVGISASQWRQDIIFHLTKKIQFTVIRGNGSEIKRLATGQGGKGGVDVSAEDSYTAETLAGPRQIGATLSKKLGTIVATSGPVDIVNYDYKYAYIHNGVPMMETVTGTGCMLTALIAAFVASNPDEPYEATISAIAMMGLAGEKALVNLAPHEGSGTYALRLIDAIFNMTGEELDAGARIELFEEKPSRCIKKDLTLYGIYGKDKTHTTEMFLAQIEGALKGGVTIFQLREKHTSTEDYIRLANAVKPLCIQYKVPFIINDNLEVALAVDADGVHLGQNDGSISNARERLGPHKIIGCSVNTVEQAKKAEMEGADYIGVGAVFQTASKEDAEVIDFYTLNEIIASVSIPVVVIGGITKTNLLELKGLPISGIALISAIFGATADLSPRHIQGRTEELACLVEEVLR